jgi:hypothetical protein
MLGRVWEDGQQRAHIQVVVTVISAGALKLRRSGVSGSVGAWSKEGQQWTSRSGWSKSPLKNVRQPGVASQLDVPNST